MPGEMCGRRSGSFLRIRGRGGRGGREQEADMLYGTPLGGTATTTICCVCRCLPVRLKPEDTETWMAWAEPECIPLVAHDLYQNEYCLAVWGMGFFFVGCHREGPNSLGGICLSPPRDSSQFTTVSDCSPSAIINILDATQDVDFEKCQKHG